MLTADEDLQRSYLGNLSTSAELWTFPASAVHNLGAALDRGPDVLEAQVKRRKPEPYHVRCSEIAHDTGGDQGLANLERMWMAEGYVASAAALVTRGHANQLRAMFGHQSPEHVEQGNRFCPDGIHRDILKGIDPAF